MQEFLISGLRSGLRGRSFHAVFLLGVALVFVAYLSGSFSPRQPGTVALDIGLSGMRFTLVLMALFWVQELVTRELERKTVLFSLAYPVSRSAFLLGRYAAVALLGLLAALVFGLALMLAVFLAGGHYDQEFAVSLGGAYWSSVLGVWLDVVTVAAFGICIAALSTVSIMPLAMGAAFAIAGKALGPTLDYIAEGADGDSLVLGKVAPVLDFARGVVPDLSRLDWRDWPLYGVVPEPSMLAWSVAMALTYALLCLALAVWLFSRREFA